MKEGIDKENYSIPDEEKQYFFGENYIKIGKIRISFNKKIKRYDYCIFAIITIIIILLSSLVIKFVKSKRNNRKRLPTNNIFELNEIQNISIQNKNDNYSKNIFSDLNEASEINSILNQTNKYINNLYYTSTYINETILKKNNETKLDNTTDKNIKNIEKTFKNITSELPGKTEEKTYKNESIQSDLDRGFDYIRKCRDGILFKEVKNFELNSIPKISAVLPVHNCAETLTAAVRSIQNQNMLNIEIVLVNDNSDNYTVNLMKELQKEDPRITIINNQKNMLTFYSRAIGVFSAKGQYIVDLDCDDMFIVDDIFDVAYDSAQKDNFDVISFKSFQSKFIENKLMYTDVFTNHNKQNLTLYQPELSCFCISNNGTETVNDLFIWGKIFKRSVYKSALDLLGYEKYSTPMIWNEDYSQLFMIYNLAKSYKFIDKYGYFHKVSFKSNSNKMKNRDKIFSDIFFDEIIFDYGKPFCKKIAAQRLNSLKLYRAFWSIDDVSKQFLYKLIIKIFNSTDIEEKYKINLIKTYNDIFPTLNSPNQFNISFVV